MVFGLKPMGKPTTKGNLDTNLVLATHRTSQMMPISPLKYAQTSVQRPMGTGKLEYRDEIPNVSYAQPFIYVKITSSKIRRSATIVSINKGN